MFPAWELRSCAYQEVRNVGFSKKFAYVLNKWSLILAKTRDLNGLFRILTSAWMFGLFSVLAILFFIASIFPCKTLKITQTKVTKHCIYKQPGCWQICLCETRFAVSFYIIGFLKSIQRTGELINPAEIFLIYFEKRLKFFYKNQNRNLHWVNELEIIKFFCRYAFGYRWF